MPILYPLETRQMLAIGANLCCTNLEKVLCVFWSYRLAASSSDQDLCKHQYGNIKEYVMI